jgi:5-methyltetrahydrofolate corrinoid/iron sulfur protein methyltransferase
MSRKGIPQNKDQRMELAAEIVACCLDQGFPIEDLYLDPVAMSVKVAQAQMKDILEAIREFKLISEPAPKTVIGLSNVSQGACKRSLINRIFLTMAASYGLDAAILDPTDKDLMDAVISSELVLNKQIYCDSYLDAYRKK